MCGIAGALTSVPGSLPDIAPMLRCMKHRGPDGEGVRSDQYCALGQRRLAIIDVSEAGQGPIPNEDGSVWVTFNGEIYNFQQIRRELIARGHDFRGKSDTEVLVHAYEEWGRESLHRLRGMFALAIWDQRTGRLFLARDRVGKKPLFYTHRSGTTYFASELQALVALPEVPRRPDLAALQTYLSWGYIPAPLTGFEHIRKLEPGHYLELDIHHLGASVQPTPYWRLDYEPKLRIGDREAGARIREALSEAVRLRLISDVPLGAFLSGGIDSSIIVGLMAAESSTPVNTYSIGFEDAAYDELVHARRIAERWGTNHHEEIVRPDAAGILPLLARHYGEPFADSSAVPTYYVAKMTRKHVTVALNGDGGDESFAGYDRYKAAKWASKIQSIPGLQQAGVLADRFAPSHLKHPMRRGARFLHAAHLEPARRYGQWMGYFGPDDKRDLCTPHFLANESSVYSLPWFEGLFDATDAVNPVDAAMSVDTRSYLPYDLLVKVDIASMANSLETRSPFLDHEVMELAARLPAEMKLKGRVSKAILKRTFQDLLPAENVRRRKMGFGVPVDSWFRGPLRDLVTDALLSKSALERGYFKEAGLRALIQEHQSGQRDHGAKLWSILMLEMWHREMVDAAPRGSS